MGGSVDQGREVTETGMASSKNVEDGAASGGEPAEAAGPQEPGDGSPAPEPTADDVASPAVSPGGKEHAVTRALASAAAGDRESQDRLWQLTYAELHQIAQRHLLGERPDHTLSATALVHEAYLRLAGPREIPWQNRAHFYAAAAQAMRRILVEHARTRARRGGGQTRLTDIEDVAALARGDSEQILAVEAAMHRLENEDPDAAAMVRLRFYAGLSVEQAAATLGISPRTAARLWTYARAVLFRWLSETREVHDDGRQQKEGAADLHGGGGTS
jgi:RNA polymerase sigma factor (TIGR02999 family)